ncbi:hypothetical protein GCM10023079_19880 [Streptomyces chitinivorans]
MHTHVPYQPFLGRTWLLVYLGWRGPGLEGGYARPFPGTGAGSEYRGIGGPFRRGRRPGGGSGRPTPAVAALLAPEARRRRGSPAAEALLQGEAGPVVRQDTQPERLLQGGGVPVAL